MQFQESQILHVAISQLRKSNYNDMNTAKDKHHIDTELGHAVVHPIHYRHFGLPETYHAGLTHIILEYINFVRACDVSFVRGDIVIR